MDGRDLGRGAFQSVDFATKRLAAHEIMRVPAEMLARDARAGELAIERVVVGKMIENDLPCLIDSWRQGVLAVVEKVADLAENPGPPLRRAADHEGVGSGAREHRARRWR